MRPALATLSLCLVLPGLLSAQIIIKPPQAKDKAVPSVRLQERRRQVDSPQDRLFYKAFYLMNGERKIEAALPLFQSYLDRSPEGRYAKKALNLLVNGLNRVGRLDEAKEVRQTYAHLLTKKKDGARSRGGKERGDAPRGPARGDNRLARMAEQLENLQKRLQEARDRGDEEIIQTLERRIGLLKRQIERMRDSGRARRPRGDRPAGEGRQGRRSPRDAGRGGRFRRGGRTVGKPLAEQSEEELAKTVERVTAFAERFAERLVDAGNEEAAEKLLGAAKRFRALVEKGKLEEAQKELSGLRQGFRRRR